MDKFENIKKLDDLLEMGDEAVMEFANRLLDQIDANEMIVEGVKYKYGFTLSELKGYLNKKYATKKGRYLNKPKIIRSRKPDKEIEKPILTDKEILALKEIVAKKDVAERNLDDCEKVLGVKNLNVCLHFTKEFQDEFKVYCKKNKQFNQSEHAMLAILEYMKKYK